MFALKSGNRIIALGAQPLKRDVRVQRRLNLERHEKYEIEKFYTIAQRIQRKKVSKNVE